MLATNLICHNTSSTYSLETSVECICLLDHKKNGLSSPALKHYNKHSLFFILQLLWYKNANSGMRLITVFLGLLESVRGRDCFLF